MTTIASFLFGIAGSLATRILLALGIGLVSYSGFKVALDSLRTKIETEWSQGGVVFDMLYLAGMGEAVGIILAAFAAKGAMYAVNKFGKVAS